MIDDQRATGDLLINVQLERFLINVHLERWLINVQLDVCCSACIWNVC